VESRYTAFAKNPGIASFDSDFTSRHTKVGTAYTRGALARQPPATLTKIAAAIARTLLIDLNIQALVVLTGAVFCCSAGLPHTEMRCL
jgi:hypothetical protein